MKSLAGCSIKNISKQFYTHCILSRVTLFYTHIALILLVLLGPTKMIHCIALKEMKKKKKIPLQNELLSKQTLYGPKYFKYIHTHITITILYSIEYPLLFLFLGISPFTDGYIMAVCVTL